MEIIRSIYLDEVVSREGIVLTSVEDPNPMALRSKLGDRLSELTMEDGMVIEPGATRRRKLIKILGFIKRTQTLFENRPLQL